MPTRSPRLQLTDKRSKQQRLRQAPYRQSTHFTPFLVLQQARDDSGDPPTDTVTNAVVYVGTVYDFA